MTRPGAPGRAQRSDADNEPRTLRMPDVETCGDCEKPIRWFLTSATRARIPVDAYPSAEVDGNLLRLPDGTMHVIPKKGQRDGMRADGKTLWMPHVATCPLASRWKSKGGPPVKRRREFRGGRR